jgi:DNA-binding transcriptional MerR regulator
MRFEALKVGKLARRTGLTIRTLHHYDEIGLLRPSLHTEAGHRLYTGSDIARLQQMISPLEVIGLHLARLREQIESQRKLCERLEAVASHLRTAGEVSADEFFRVIEGMTMMEKYFTPEKLGPYRAWRALTVGARGRGGGGSGLSRVDNGACAPLAPVSDPRGNKAPLPIDSDPAGEQSPHRSPYADRHAGKGQTLQPLRADRTR